MTVKSKNAITNTLLPKYTSTPAQPEKPTVLSTYAPIVTSTVAPTVQPTIEPYQNVKIELPTCPIKVGNSYVSVQVNSMEATIEKAYISDAKVTIKIRGTKIYDDDGNDGNAACYADYKIYNDNNEVVESSLISSGNIAVNENFSTEILLFLNSGSYKLAFSNVIESVPTPTATPTQTPSVTPTPTIKSGFNGVIDCIKKNGTSNSENTRYYYTYTQNDAADSIKDVIYNMYYLTEKPDEVECSIRIDMANSEVYTLDIVFKKDEEIPKANFWMMSSTSAMLYRAHASIYKRFYTEDSVPAFIADEYQYGSAGYWDIWDEIGTSTFHLGMAGWEYLLLKPYGLSMSDLGFQEYFNK